MVSMGDLFHPAISYLWLDRVFTVIKQAAPIHTFILCTKQAAQMKTYITYAHPDLDQTHPNIWGLVTAEDQERAEERIPHLLRTPLAVRGLSMEPLLEDVDLTPWLYPHESAGYSFTVPKEDPRLSWVILGGESGRGPKIRRFPINAASYIVRELVSLDIPVFVKQMGTIWSIAQGTWPTDPKGANMSKFPLELQVRQWPITVLAGVEQLSLGGGL